jgi:NADPH:quinone reductase-like Zn-dependent oxidoreductase
VKAILYRAYGSPDVLQCEEVEKPAPGDNDVLIKVRAASVNPLDWHQVRGKPYVMRVMGGLRQPKVATRLGVDVAGEVEAVGKSVTQFKPGDPVFGGWLRLGAFAEYVCAPESAALLVKPDHLTFDQAASVPVAGFTALQGVRDKAHIQPGRKILVNGAAGGVGTFAVQIAKSFGADVTGVCSTRNVDMVRSLGADRVVDYTREDFTGSGPRYDAVFDCVGNRSLSEFTRVLHPNGVCVIAAGPDGLWLGPLTRFIEALARSPFASQKLLPFIARPNKDDLRAMVELMSAGKVTPVIDRTYTLAEVPEAVRYVEQGHARGKVVITMNP